VIGISFAQIIFYCIAGIEINFYVGILEEFSFIIFLTSLPIEANVPHLFPLFGLDAHSESL
jgi:hypothetical protein